MNFPGVISPSVALRRFEWVDKSFYGRSFASPSPCPSHQGRENYGLAILSDPARLEFHLCVVQRRFGLGMSSTALNSLSLLWERVGVRESKQIKRARGLRRASTEAEKLLWQKLRARQLGGAKFRRQTPIGPYIVDFASFEHRLVVEIDGGQHNMPQGRQHDCKRTAWLEGSRLFRVLRFWNNQVLNDLEGVLERTLQELEG